jgi:hypothetical protein
MTPPGTADGRDVAAPASRAVPWLLVGDLLARDAGHAACASWQFDQRTRQLVCACHARLFRFAETETVVRS